MRFRARRLATTLGGPQETRFPARIPRAQEADYLRAIASGSLGRAEPDASGASRTLPYHVEREIGAYSADGA